MVLWRNWLAQAAHNRWVLGSSPRRTTRNRKSQWKNPLRLFYIIKNNMLDKANIEKNGKLKKYKHKFQL